MTPWVVENPSWGERWSFFALGTQPAVRIDTVAQQDLRVRSRGALPVERDLDSVLAPQNREAFTVSLDQGHEFRKVLRPPAVHRLDDQVSGVLVAGVDGRILVELEPKTFDTCMDVKLFLERLLGRRVDLVLADAVKPRLPQTIFAEAVHAEGL